MLEDAKGEGRAGRLGFMTESKEWISDTVSDMGETALVGPPPALPWRRMVKGISRGGIGWKSWLATTAYRSWGINEAMTSTKAG